MDRVVILVDTSGSMSSCKEDMEYCIKDTLNALYENNPNSDCRVSLINFNSIVKSNFEDLTSKEASKTKITINPSGQTALLDAVGKTIENIKNSDSYLILVFTDGEENASYVYNKKLISSLIKSRQDKGNWTFAFNVPPGSKKTLESFGVPSDNIREWETTKESIKETTFKTKEGFKRYFTARNSGSKSIDTFYTDLSNVSIPKIRNNLDNISKDYVKLTVGPLYHGFQIRDFVKTFNINYKIGNGFYELTKPELVQENKEILVMEIGKDVVWGGSDARSVLGIPEGRIKIIPKNHSKYKIFVQSNSVNRKLLKNTVVLYRK